MRIIAGEWKGKRLEGPKDASIRPTSDRTRESLFNILTHMQPDPVAEARVVDLCCGSGALGLEALSRGARHVTFVDHFRDAIQLCEKNIRQLGANSRTKVVQENVNQLHRAEKPVDLVLMDPPYEHETIVVNTFEALKRQGWLKSGTILVFEQPKKRLLPDLPGTERLKERAYGRSQIVLYRFDG